MAAMKRAHRARSTPPPRSKRAKAPAPPSCPASPSGPPLPSLLAGIDLNLLVALDALLLERSVTRAAQRIGMTQSSLSHVLRRLRALLGDPLFIKTPRGMQPTALAAELGPPLRGALGAIEEALRTRPRFDAKRSSRAFTLASSDYGILLLLPRLVARLQRLAPGISLAVRPATDKSAEELCAGELDLLLGAVPPQPADILSRRLLSDRFVCLLRAEHPLARDGRLSLDQYVALPHLLISPMGRGATWVDPVLERLGLRRRIALRVPQYLAAPHIVAETDLVLTIAARVARALRGALPLREVPPPVEIPGFSISAYWHAHRQDDAGHRFLRELLFAIAAEVADEGPDEGRAKGGASDGD